ncbi:DUF3237 domain-containing protein [Marinobacterium rhizophilum]|uniref:DUF3237 domain-containing protein n=1 Tax=Marinobacterium rhizophilum TaxID=420402 RepID=UPI000360316E|nr:DUF3237 domain-containing protein [Marinobacterium rhizophilum]
MTALPTLKPFAKLQIQVDSPQEVGTAQHGLRRLIPILGGQVVGDGWEGRVLRGGADYQLIVTPRMAELDARYTIETDGGDYIYVQNRAIRVADPDTTARLVRGESVDPSLIYFRCSPSFETVSPSLKWICERLFIGTGIRRPDDVELELFEVC